MRFDRSLFAIAFHLHRCFRSWHGRRYLPLFFRRQLEDVIRQKLSMVSRIALERGRGWPGEYPLMVLLLE